MVMAKRVCHWWRAPPKTAQNGPYKNQLPRARFGAAGPNVLVISGSLFLF
jgi:hypothetical protein